jgi:hypothetical protein
MLEAAGLFVFIDNTKYSHFMELSIAPCGYNLVN